MTQAQRPHGLVVLTRREIDAVLFDMDGVITSTRTLHEAAWGDVFRSRLGDAPPMSHADYRAHIDGRRREDGARAFLLSRGLPAPDDVVADITAEKDALYRAELARRDVRPLPGVEALLQRLASAGIAFGLFTASRNAEAVLSAAGLADAFGAVVDGNAARRDDLTGKPAPDMLLACARRLGCVPPRCAVFEDSVAGIAAAVTGGFPLIVGVGADEDADRLTAAGAHAVVATLQDVEVEA